MYLLQVWTEAWATALRHPNATVLHTDPDIIVIEDFLTVEECDDLRALLEHRKKTQWESPRWCFDSVRFDPLEALYPYPHLVPPTYDDGQWCIHDQQVIVVDTGPFCDAPMPYVAGWVV